MKLSLFFIISLTQFGFTWAQTLHADVPSCALPCTIPLLTEYNCNPSNISACICSNVELQAKNSKCVQTACSISDLTAIEEVQNRICAGYPTPTLQPRLIASSVILSFFVLMTVGLRFWSRYAIAMEFWWDDWIILMTTIFFLVLQAVSIWGDIQGFGLHIWNVQPLNRVSIYKFLWVYEIIYVLVRMLAKLSVLLTYRRIFPRDWLRATIVFLSILTTVQGIINIFVFIFLCQPIAFVFNKNLNGKCFDVTTVVLASGIICFVEDVVFICLPIPAIIKLRLPTARKIAVLSILCIGIIACIVSVIRLKYIDHVSSNIDPNWDDFGIVTTSSIELSISLICISVAAIKPLWSSWFPHYSEPSDSSHASPVSLNLRNSDTPAQGNKALARMKSSLSYFSKRQSKNSKNFDVSAPPWRDIDHHVPSVDDDIKLVEMNLSPNPSVENV